MGNTLQLILINEAETIAHRGGDFTFKHPPRKTKLKMTRLENQVFKQNSMPFLVHHTLRSH